MLRRDDGILVPKIPKDGGGGAKKTADADTGFLFEGLAPDWGPFGALGNTARTVIQILMAGVLIFLLGRAIVSFGNMKMGQNQNDPVAVHQGRNNVIGSLIGVFAVASIGTLFTLVYGMGI